MVANPTRRIRDPSKHGVRWDAHLPPLGDQRGRQRLAVSVASFVERRQRAPCVRTTVPHATFVEGRGCMFREVRGVQGDEAMEKGLERGSVLVAGGDAVENVGQVEDEEHDVSGV